MLFLILKKYEVYKMKTKKYMLYDKDEGFYDIYLFKDYVETKEIDEVVKNHIASCIDENRQEYWDMESIEKEIKKHFEVKEVILFWNDTLDVIELAKDIL
jgi:hypothetical protein